MGNIAVEFLKATMVANQEVELVERKGKGHPDHIVDAIMDKVSQKLSQYYLKEFGQVLHHNIDKALLVAGKADTRFGGGEITEPMLLVFGDRATVEFRNKIIPVAEIAKETAIDWFKSELRFVDPLHHVRYQVEIKPASPELSSIFDDQTEIFKANDTSAAVGYAPLSPTEQMVYDTEKLLNSPEMKKEFPEIGEDIKVMGYRFQKELILTVALAFVDRFIANEDDYFEKKERLRRILTERLPSNNYFEKVRFDINTLDERSKGISGVYTTVSGTSAESGDSGQVGRGNRINGLISLNRPMGTEAAAGKNPVSHVGKIYNFLSHKIATKVYEEIEGINEVYVWLCSQIGKPVNDPLITTLQIVPQVEVDRYLIEKKAKEISLRELSNIKTLIKDLIEGKLSVC